MVSIPIVDFSIFGSLNDNNWLKCSEDLFKTTGNEIVAAFHKIGFVYLENCGIDQSKVNDVRNVGADFFNLQEDEKMKYLRLQTKSPGYTPINAESLAHDRQVFEIRESFDSQATNENYPNQFMEETIKNFSVDIKQLVARLLLSLELGLGLPKNTLSSKHNKIWTDENCSCLRILHYPPVPEFIEPGSVRCSAHTDYGTFTLLFQDDIGGLEVKTPQGDWVEAPPLEGAILVNAGDLLQRWTSDFIVSTVHRVLIPSQNIKKKTSRRSLVTFIHPDADVLVKPLHGSSKYKPITAEDYVIGRFESTLKL